MPAIHVPAANQQLADRAGQTGAGLEQATARGVSPAEQSASYFHQAGGDLSHVLSGGLHPESPIPQVVSTALEQATNSARGRLGGLKPALGSVLAPGPAGTIAGARARALEVAARLAELVP